MQIYRAREADAHAEKPLVPSHILTDGGAPSLPYPTPTTPSYQRTDLTLTSGPSGWSELRLH